MSRKVFVISMLTVALSALANAALVNGSFEEQGNDADRASGWDRWGDWVNRETDWTPTHDGSCLLGYHHWQIEKSETSGIWQDIEDVEPGTIYTLSVYANADPAGDSAENPKEVELRLESTIDGEQVTVASQKFNFSDLATGDDWSQLQVRATAPNEVMRAVVVVTPAESNSRGGAIKFDDASLVSE